MNGFGQTKPNWPGAWKKGLNPRKFVIFRSLCDRQKCIRFLHRGGFRRRLPIGPDNLGSREARMKV